MISTMPKSGQAPSSPNAMPGGLGAILQQPGGAPKGASSRSMQQMVDIARKMSDMQLADVLAGKSLDVPQYVAMTEAMGRKSLRTAMQGTQAQQQARQPSVKDKLLAEEAAAQMPQQVAGLDQLPAPNMESVGMADGGIVAFADTGLVPSPEGDLDLETYENRSEKPGRKFDRELMEKIKNIPGAISNFLKEQNRPWTDVASNVSPSEMRAVTSGKISKGMLPPESPYADLPKTTTATPSQAEIDAIRATNVLTGSKPDSLGRHVANIESAGTGGGAPKKSGIAAILDGETEPKKAADDYLAKLAGIGEKTRAGIAGLKNEAQSQMLFDAMSALLGNRNIAEAGSKFGQLAAGRVGAMGKEGRTLEKEANDYDLNLARYREAVASGDKDRALQAQKMMLENQYHMAMVNKPGETMQLLSALGDPEMMKRYQEMNISKKPTNIVSKDTALKEWGDMLPSQKRAYGNDFNTFYSSLSGSTMGGGSDLASAAAAELARRKTKT